MEHSVMPNALITGITGQDGSYLAELLLAKGYNVFGVVRRVSKLNDERIRHLLDKIAILEADLLDQLSLVQAIRASHATEVYNLAAMSFVGTSFAQPVATGEYTALSVTRMLEAVRLAEWPIRFYQASTSEMFGKAQAIPQNEQTPFYPRSPYGVSKLYGHWSTINARESYGLYACSGILFNHECVTAETPVFIRRNGQIDILPIEDVVPHRTNPKHGTRYTTDPGVDGQIEVWDAAGWSRVTCMTATWNGFTHKPNKQLRRIATRGSVFHATSDHIVFASNDGEITEQPAGEVKTGDSLTLIPLPAPTSFMSVTEDEAWLLGILASEGYVSDEGKVTVTNQDQALLDSVASCWTRVCGGTSSTYRAPSGFANGRESTQLRLTGARAYGRYLREQLYTRSSNKRIPGRVLNASAEAQLAFLRGFNAGDGLKSTPCTYEFQGFKSSSAVMAAGLYWLAVTTLNQRAIICLESRSDSGEERLYYQVNLNSPNTPGEKGAHLRRPLNEVVKAEPVAYQGWLFDLATTTGTFHAGVGQGWIHNSPRRGREFVTRKISHGVASIKLGVQDALTLGNLDAKRDWGFAGDYVEAMWLMLQQDEPNDYVIATGVTHSVRDFVAAAFAHVGIPEWQRYVKTDERYLRPAEVDLLIGDASKAESNLGWRPKVAFEQLVAMMVDNDLREVARENNLSLADAADTPTQPTAAQRG
jgi:GDPmannose 4,6-dehydratase